MKLDTCSTVEPFAALAALACLLAAPSSAHAEDSTEDSPRDSVEISGELGFLDPLYHRVQFSKGGTYFDYVEDGGQNVLFGFKRLSADLEFNEQHHVVFLYQPLRIETRVRLSDDLVVDNLTFPEGRTVDLVYGFPFYRASYLYDFLEDPRREVAIGGSLQLRNATITFTSVDGELHRENRDVGPVPVVKFRGRTPLAGSSFWFAFEADGFYAPVKYLNGGDSDVVGAIVDASLRVGRSFGGGLNGYLNARYLAGGGEGTNEDQAGPGDGFVKNWLHFATISLGFSYRYDLR